MGIAMVLDELPRLARRPAASSPRLGTGFGTGLSALLVT
jgi:hypothetical protein